MLRQYNLLSAEALANPYPLYHQLRSEDPVHLDNLLGCWLITSYQEVVSAFSNPSLSSARITVDRLRGKKWEKLQPLFYTASNQMVFLDPPDHTRLRALVSKAFTPHVVQAMRPHIQELVNGLLDKLHLRGRMDVINDFAYPLPSIVIAQMLGVPSEDHNQFKTWCNDIALFLGNPATLEQSRQALQSMGELKDYFRGLIAQRHKFPLDNLLNALLIAKEEGKALSKEELLANCVLLLFAGETTTNLIGNGLLALLQTPAQLQKLKHNPSLITTAVEEMLRYDSPTQWTGRLAKEDIEIGGKQIGKGQGVMLMIGAANRDPSIFPEPDRFDISRNKNRHIAFGHSIHFCLGAALARIEGQVAIETIIRRMPNLQFEEEALEWQENFSFRGLKSLNITF